MNLKAEKKSGTTQDVCIRIGSALKISVETQQKLISTSVQKKK